MVFGQTIAASLFNVHQNTPLRGVPGDQGDPASSVGQQDVGVTWKYSNLEVLKSGCNSRWGCALAFTPG